MPPIVAVLYILLSMLVASESRNTRLGFWGALSFCLIFTPFAGFFVQRLMASPKTAKKSVSRNAAAM